MSLLEEAMESCTMLDKITGPDGYGGKATTWKPGVEFKAAISINQSTQARIGLAQGVTNVYTVTTPKEMTLEFHDVFRRERDDKIFRVTSDGDDKATPASASINMRVVTAEEWRIPADGQSASNS